MSGTDKQIVIEALGPSGLGSSGPQTSGISEMANSTSP